MQHQWSILGCEPTTDVKAVKRAYAARLKFMRPEDDAQGFQRLREAYEWALKYGVVWAQHDQEDTDDADEYESTEEEPQAPVVYLPPNRPEAPVSFTPSVVFSVPPIPEPKPEPNPEPKPEPEPEPYLQPGIQFKPLLTLPDLPPNVSPGQLPGPVPGPPPGQPLSFQNPNPVTPMSAPPVSLPVAPQAHYVNVPLTHLLETRAEQVFLQALYEEAKAANRAARGDERVRNWLVAQPEFESLTGREALDNRLQAQLEEHRWPWPAVVACSQLLEWGTIGNPISEELHQAVRIARMQWRAALTPPVPWYELMSARSAAWNLLQPFQWPIALLRNMLPTRAKVDQIIHDVVDNQVDPAEVFNPEQVHFQNALRLPGFNWSKTCVMLTRCLVFPFLILGLFVATSPELSWRVPLIWSGISFGMWLAYAFYTGVHASIWLDLAQGSSRFYPVLRGLSGLIAGSIFLFWADVAWVKDTGQWVAIPCMLFAIAAGRTWPTNLVIPISAALAAGAVTQGIFKTVGFTPFILGGSIGALLSAYFTLRYYQKHPSEAQKPETSKTAWYEFGQKIPWWMIIWIGLALARVLSHR
jgi:hypothetical protein